MAQALTSWDADPNGNNPMHHPAKIKELLKLKRKPETHSLWWYWPGWWYRSCYCHRSGGLCWWRGGCTLLGRSLTEPLVSIVPNEHIVQIIIDPQQFSCSFRRMLILKPWPNGLASWCKTQVCKTRTSRTCDTWPNGFASWLTSSLKLQISHIYSSLAINLCWLAFGGQMVKKVRPLADEFELDQSQHKSSQARASQRKWVAKQNASWTQVENFHWLASPFDQGLIPMYSML